MKKKLSKKLVAAIVAGLTLAASVPALAAVNPFTDVPAKHWAYAAVSKLAAEGIVDGYGDGTFRGDRAMTRYEMAQAVAKAMAHEDRANAEQKAMIEKLAQEFQDELNTLGIRLTKLENKVGNITWSGQVRSMYEWVEDLGSQRNTRLLLFMKAPLTDNLSFHGRIWAESGWGENTPHAATTVIGWNNHPLWGHFPHNHAASTAVTPITTGSDMSMDQAYLEYKKGNISWTFGRQGFMLGQGLVYAFFPGNDGATLTLGSDKTKVTFAALKTNWIVGNNNLYAANITHKASDTLDLSLVYAKNRSGDKGHYLTGGAGEVFDTWAVGGVYKGIPDVTLTAEYGQNKSDRAKWLNGDDATAWVTQAKYKGAQWDKVHSFGAWVGYRKAERGFNGRNGDYIWEVPFNDYNMENEKGFDVGIDYTVFKNGILTLQYFDLKDEHTGLFDNKAFAAQLRYMF